MDWAGFFSSLPAAGWAAIFLVACALAGFLAGLYFLLVKKEVKLGKLEILSPAEKKSIGAAANRLLENQSANAHNLLGKVWTDIYETGCRIFSIADRQEMYLLEDMARIIDSRLRYAVHLDLLRNNISGKTREGVLRYAGAKAEGYWRLIRTLLHSFNAQLPRYPLPSILDAMDKRDFDKVFEEIYLSSRDIAGGRDDREAKG